MDDTEKLDEIYRLTKDTNRMLRSMRRNAFWGGLIKFIVYAVLLLAPVWFYMTYLNESVQQMLHAVDQMNTAGAKASAQFGDIGSSLKDLGSKIPSFLKGSSGSSGE